MPKNQEFNKTVEDIEASDDTGTPASKFFSDDEAVEPEKVNDKTYAWKDTEAFGGTESTTSKFLSDDEAVKTEKYYDETFTWKIVAVISTTSLVAVIIVAAVLLLCIKKTPKVINIYNLAGDSTILNNESRTICESFINRPMPPVPSPCPKISDQNHSYCYPNVLQTGFSRANKDDYQPVGTKENHSYHYPQITNEVLQQIARESAFKNNTNNDNVKQIF